jgi:hypothetical protein
MDLNLNANFLFASLVWGGVGMGFFVYGKKQRAFIPLYGGIVMIGLSYIISSALYMSGACIGLIGFMYFLHRNGY